MASHTIVVTALALVFIATSSPGQWGGAWGGRGIGPRRLAKRSPNKLQPVLRAQQWLVSIQREDGSFAPGGEKAPPKPARATKRNSSKKPKKAVDREVTEWTTTGSTSLALLLFLASGNTCDRGEHQSAVRRATNWLRRHQGKDGSFESIGRGRWTSLEHAWVTLALAESHYMSRVVKPGDPDVAAWRVAADRAMTHLLALRHPDGGWSANPRMPFSNPFTTGWAIMASQAASRLLRRNWESEKSLEWLQKVTKADGDLLLLQAASKESDLDLKIRKGRAMSTTLFARFFMGQDPRKVAVMYAVADRLGDGYDQPGLCDDPMFRCVSAQAQYQLSHTRLRPRDWHVFDSRVLPGWAAEQIRDGADSGSWPPKGAIGRTMTTALNALAQSSRFRFTRIVR
jgi:Prenyltransferase and squalene oxidase repeat